MLGRADRRWKTRVIALDTNGVEHAYATGSGTPAGSMEAWTFAFRDRPLAAVREFQIQVRPVHWFEFRRIALQPRHPVPREGPVQLLYTAGLLEKPREVTPDFRGMMSLDGNSRLGGVGQNEQDNAFVTVVVDPQGSPSKRFDTVALTRNSVRCARR